jgi:hypothetical protein
MDSEVKTTTFQMKQILTFAKILAKDTNKENELHISFYDNEQKCISISFYKGEYFRDYHIENVNNVRIGFKLNDNMDRHLLYNRNINELDDINIHILENKTVEVVRRESNEKLFDFNFVDKITFYDYVCAISGLIYSKVEDN